MDTHRQRSLPLRLLQPRPQLQMPVSIEHGQHVRMDGHLPMLASQESKREAHQLFFFLLVFFRPVFFLLFFLGSP